MHYTTSRIKTKLSGISTTPGWSTGTTMANLNSEIMKLYPIFPYELNGISHPDFQAALNDHVRKSDAGLGNKC